MCSMRNADDSRQDSARELMEDWNLGSEEEPSHHSLADRAAALPCEFGLDNEPASPQELGAEDSFPAGATLLYQAFAPMSPRPAGPGSRKGGPILREPATKAGAGKTVQEPARLGRALATSWAASGWWSSLAGGRLRESSWRRR